MNKIQFESEEQLKEFIGEVVYGHNFSGIRNNEEYDRNLKSAVFDAMKLVYIKKSDLEIAREKFEALTGPRNPHIDIEDLLSSSREVIELQQKEIERLKNER